MKNTKILLAVSGGRDSVYMLHRMIEEGEYSVFVAHFNHKMRGSESDRDADFVKNLCEQLHIPCLVGEPEEVLHSEEDARNARYDFLENTRQYFGCELIATAHTADDNAETILFNLTRGTGLKGLCGIPEKRGNIIRPLLNVSRKEIDGYILEHGLQFVEDSTNNSDIYSRNVIRHNVIPVLKQINPNFIEAVSRTVSLLKYDEEYLSKEADKYTLDNVADYDKAIASRVVRRSCPGNLSSSQVEDVLAFAKSTEYGELDLPGIKLIRDKGKLKTEESAPEFDICLSKCKAELVNSSLNTCYIKRDSIKGEIVCGVKQDGDIIKIAGRNCTKSLKKLFREAGLTMAEKKVWPVIRDNEGVLYVYKIGLAERAKAEPGDNSIKVTITEKNNA